jgi:hypothetical protein
MEQPHTFNIDRNIISMIEPPEPLPKAKKAVIPFSRDLLPDELADYVDNVAQRLQCPADFVAVSVLCSLASLLGNQAVIQPKINDDWQVYPTLWGMLIAPPSAKKSPALKQALNPMLTLEKQLQHNHQHAMLQYSADKELWEMKKDKAKTEAKKILSNSANESQAKGLLTDIAESEPQKPTPQRLVVNDATIAKLGEILQENPKGVLYLRDELSSLLSQLAKEDNTTDRAFLMECFNGNGYFTFDRIMRGTVSIENCTVSLLGGIQPSAIVNMIRETVKGNRDDGLFQRFQLAVYPEPVKNRGYVDQAVDREAFNQYQSIVSMFFNFNFYDQDRQPRVFTFDQQAQQIFIQWYNSLCENIHDDHYNPAYISHLQKMDKTIPTIALIFELISSSGQSNTISALSLARACEWFDYLKSHAEAIYAMVIHSQYDNARRILNSRHKLNKLFTMREIKLKGWSGLTENSDIIQAIELLLEHRYLFILPETQNTGRKTTRYYWSEALKN